MEALGNALSSLHLGPSVDFNLVKIDLKWPRTKKAKSHRPAYVKADVTYRANTNSGEIALKEGSNVIITYPLRLKDEILAQFRPLLDTEKKIAEFRQKFGEPSESFVTSQRQFAQVAWEVFEDRTKLAAYHTISMILKHKRVQSLNLVWRGDLKFNFTRN